jgi:uncharacterized OB-fold protein
MTSPLPIMALPDRRELDELRAGLALGRLVLPRCRTCGQLSWPPRGLCGHCGSPAIDATTLTGTGHVYSVTVNHRGRGAYDGVGPFALAYIELDEGVRIMSNVVGCPPDDVAIGMRVRACVDTDGDGGVQLRFRPDPEAEPDPERAR